MPTNTPSWLKIDDENFRDLLEYLCSNARTKDTDPFYAAARELLGDRVQSLIPSLANDLSGDNDTLLFRTRLLGAWLLCFPEESEQKSTVFFCMLNCLAQVVGESYAQKLFMLSLRVLSCSGIDLVGFSWDDLKDISAETLAHKIVTTSVIGAPAKREQWHDGKGLLRVDGERIVLMPVNRKAFGIEGSRMVESMKIAEDRLCVITGKDDKLKQSDSADIAKIDSFTSDFRRLQKGVTPTPPETKRYADSQEVMVRVTGISGDKLMLETADPNYEKIAGTFHHTRGLFYYQDSDFMNALRVGECFKAKVLNREKGWFSVYDNFQEIMLTLMQQGDTIPAEFIMTHKEGSLWLTNDGIPVYVKDPGYLSPNDRAFITIELVGSNGYIRGVVDENQEGIENEEFDDAKGYFIRNYIIQDYEIPQVKSSAAFDRDHVRILERALYNYQKTLSRASEIYKVLCYCQMLSELTGDERELHYLELKADYLEQLVFFTKGQYLDMKALEPSPDIADEPSIVRSVDIVRILMEIQRKEDSDLLSTMIHTHGDPLVVRIARILQSYNRIKDIVPESTLTEIKMEITKALSLDSEVASSLDDEDDEFLGMEDKVKEFKTSFVFPADKSQHMRANMKMQSRNVYKAICAFLNSMVGGTLYLGVSDAGYVVGIGNDLEELKCNMDKYIRIIQDESKSAFDKGILDFLDFEVMFGGRVVAIKVKPFDNGVVCLDGVAYRRNFGESVPMREDEKMRLISTKVVTGLKTGSKIEVLEQAIREKKRVWLRRYTSHTGVGDHKVEPFKVFNGGRSVWCYDLEDKLCKQFSVSRMAAVDLLQDMWSHEEEHEAKQTDIFNWSGGKSMHIEVDMDMIAKNILLDECPQSERFLKPKTKAGETWTLSTDVFDCKAPGRFCIGLAEHVTVVAGDELKQYIADYIRENLVGSIGE